MLIRFYIDLTAGIGELARYAAWYSFRPLLWPLCLLIDLLDGVAWLAWAYRLQCDTPALELLQALADAMVELVAALIVAVCDVRDQMFVALGGRFDGSG